MKLKRLPMTKETKQETVPQNPEVLVVKKVTRLPIPKDTPVQENPLRCD
ncbi:MAG: hypothetical protein ACI9SY_000729 [Candidatus Paceibacteria bacterium]|jgi:hypothetical protein